MTALLVPVDGSPSSLNALQAALNFLKNDTSARLHVISVQPPILSGNVKRFVPAETIDDYYNEEGEKALASAREMLEKSGAAANVSVQVGPVAETVVEYAKSHQCDHIVMGTRGMGYIKGLVLGSITTKVLSLTDLPVTLIK
ncbi:universal stress protein [Eoetvoesiella caeni]|uniref:Nucleotide-binding universal stress UspA family protein n=1 Tax=Eoetvoesiella caeni TaxID=645616 RepID=A0A366HDY8_9BURK|nr:universal stress protein [Eoetvoesiella caeni]MCI2808798.1 universal stress protein [Eoetvoesiella caeni]NYT55338.1 universal stress protein [Eoetvoesiella caeni]RBP40680.1 nucleotide-binding universal stress UspA family protein [Eoetvoesiella caeni]